MISCLVGAQELSSTVLALFETFVLMLVSLVEEPGFVSIVYLPGNEVVVLNGHL